MENLAGISRGKHSNELQEWLTYSLHTLGYPGMEDLQALDNCRMRQPVRISPAFKGVTSPLHWEVWQEALGLHPDKRYVDYLITGLREGFRIGFNYKNRHCKKCKENMRSAKLQPQVVAEYIQKECEAGRILGPLDPQLFPEVQISRFGVIPKTDPGKWRLILDLSSPDGASVNDGIDPERCSLTYMKVDDAARAIERMGRGAKMAKVDIKSAYRMIPVHPEDRPLLGMLWEGALYVDTALPFGLRSAPKVFTAVADGLEWRLRLEGVQQVFHYLDDFLIVTPPESPQCERELQKLLQVFNRLGVPIAEDKLIGPTISLTFLGIELDTSMMIRRLPVGKLTELQQLVAEWLPKKACRVKELQSLPGKLQHACKVVRPGRTFLRRVFELLRGIGKRQQFVRLNASFKSDLWWWHCFLDSWNGVAMMENCPSTDQEIHLYTDASGSFGCGAWWGVERMQLQWPTGTAEWSIVHKELLPIVLACMIWGKRWTKHRIMVHCDNAAVVEVVAAGYSKEANLMHLLRCLFLVTAFHELSMRPIHIPGVQNVAADAISRNNMVVFNSQVPGATHSPVDLPPEALDLLIGQRPDWTSPAWCQWFNSWLRRA